MNPKSVAIIVVVAVVVAGISYGTYLMDSDDKLELRDYLVEGDWVEYDHETSDYSEKYTVLSVEAIDLYNVSVSDYYTVSVSFLHLFTIIDPNDENVEYLRSETVDTFLGSIECDVYFTSDYWSDRLYYVEPDTNLVLMLDSTDYDGITYRTVMTGTSLFDPVVPEFVKIEMAQPGVGSSYTYKNMYDYESDDGFISGNWSATTTVDSVNADGTLNIIDCEEPVTVEQFVSGLKMTEEEKASSTIVEAKVVSTQWGVMMCHVYIMPYQDPESGDIWEKTFIVEPSTGIVLNTITEMHDVEYSGYNWEDGELESVLIDCDLIYVTD